MSDNSWHEKISSFYFGESVKMTNLVFWQQLLVAVSLFTIFLIVAAVAYLLVKKVVFNFISRMASKTDNSWDDELMTSRIFRRLSLLVPIAIVWHAAPLCFGAVDMEKVSTIGDIIRVISEVLLVAYALLSLSSLLNVSERIYSRYEVSKELPIKSFVQVVKIILTIIGIIFVISSVIGKSPVLIFSGLGAMTAVLMLIFKDALLGLVAGIQLSANRMVARGDWIEMPKFGADGEVIEVALTTVKVSNWDKTITTIPTYALISDSFKNWRGMSNSGVRRIKRSINLDINSVRFLDEKLLERLKGVSLLEKYMEQKEKENAEWNAQLGEKANDFVNARAMTNVGTFRAYINEYMKHHQKISQKDTLLVRQLQPTQYGLPIEIYVFSTDNGWINYEGIQSDIFDHLFAVLKEFDLRAFQSPSGLDFAKMNGAE